MYTGYTGLARTDQCDLIPMSQVLLGVQIQGVDSEIVKMVLVLKKSKRKQPLDAQTSALSEPPNTAADVRLFLILSGT